MNKSLLWASESKPVYIIIIIIKSTVYCIAHFILLHILLFIFSSYLKCFNFLPIFMYNLLCCVTYFALSIERTWPDLHLITDYILFNWVCDK